MTRAPTGNDEPPGSSTTPAPSFPNIKGAVARGKPPDSMVWSSGVTLAAVTRTSTLPSTPRGLGTSTSFRPPYPVKDSARMALIIALSSSSGLRGRKPRASPAAETCVCIYLGKKSGPGRELRDLREGRHQAPPCPLRQQRLHPRLRPLPRGPGFFELRHPAGGDREPLLAAVVPGPDGDPAGVHERTEAAGQRRLVVQRQLGQVPLPDFAGPAEQLEQRVLGREEADAAQLLVIEPADGPRRLPQDIAQARGGGRFVSLGSHITCIRRQLAVVKGSARYPIHL